MSFTHTLIGTAGLGLIMRFESLRLTAYLCPANKVTIGYGHVLRPKAGDAALFGMSSSELLTLISRCQTARRMTDVAVYRLRISQVVAEALLSQDAQQTALFLRSISANTLSQHQFDALGSFIFNVGEGNFAQSTLRNKLNAGDFAGAAAEFDKWVYATVNGKKVKLAGLVTRRAAERALFEHKGA